MGVDQIKCLNYMQWHSGLLKEKPYQLVSEDLPTLMGIPRQNFDVKAAPPEKITDIRGCQSDFNLDQHAFQYLSHQFPKINFFDENDVETIYKPAVVKMLRDHVSGVDEVAFFHWRLRANRRDMVTSRLGKIHDPTDLLVPAHFVHLDQTLKTAIEYAREQVGDRADYLLQGRLRILNIWKPIEFPVYDCPLAVCDGSTVRQEDMIVCDNITKAKVGEVVLPLFNENARWHYLHQQTPDEVTIMKIVDSDQSVKATCCAHCAFDQDDFDQSTPPRRSIEMRALVFTYPPAD